MAPLQQGQKRSHDQEEERPAKRIEVVAEEAETGDDEGSHWSDLEPFVVEEVAWRREDFTQHPTAPVELSEEDLGKFNAAFVAAQADWAQEEGRVLVMGSPLDVRPVPLSADDLKERLATFRLSDYGIAQKIAFEDELDSAMMEEEDEEEEPATEDEGAASPAAGQGQHGEKVLQLLQTYVAAAEAETDLKQAVQVAVVVTHGLLDAELEDICEVDVPKADLLKVLGMLAKVWKGLFKQSAEALGVTEQDRRGAAELTKLIQQAVDDETFVQGALKGAFNPLAAE